MEGAEKNDMSVAAHAQVDTGRGWYMLIPAYRVRSARTSKEGAV